MLIGGGNLFRVEGNTFRDCKIGVHIDARGKSWKRWTEDPEWFARAIGPFLGEVWQEAYPDVERTLRDDPAAPWNNAIVGNVFERNGRNFLFDAGTMSVTNRMQIAGNIFK